MGTKAVVGWIVALAAINWGLVGLLNLNLVEAILGMGTTLTKVVYIIIGVVGVYKAYMLLMGTSKKKIR